MHLYFCIFVKKYMEIFKSCDYLPDGYKVSNLGNVINKNGKVLKKQLSNSGYYFYVLKKNKKQKSVFLHRAIAFSFVENPFNKDCVNHKNGIKTDNRVENLEWVTKSENIKHCYDIGLKKYKPLHYKGKFGKDHNRSKSVFCVTNKEKYGSASEAARELKISVSGVCLSIKQNKPIKGFLFEWAKF